MHFCTQKNDVGFGYDVFVAHHKCTQATKVQSLVELDGLHVPVQSTPFHSLGSEPDGLLCDSLE
jgi:hypothetical protein